MASLGHIAIGMAAARAYRGEQGPRWPSMALWSALSLAPDADVIGFGLGVPYGDPWGHRGATHSLTFAVAVASAIGLAAPKFGLSRRRTWVLASVVLASHGLLDTLTDGGLGCALFWPFDLTRYFAPWRPIPVAPIGLSFLSPYGFLVALTELVLFAPVIAFALRASRFRVFFVPLWSVAVWLIVSGDQYRESVMGFILREDTEFADSFSDRAFHAITSGQTDTEVRNLLGAPLEEWWDYSRTAPWEISAAECLVVYFESNVVSRGSGASTCMARGIRLGMTRAEVNRSLGAPAFMCWGYSRSPTDRYFRARMVCFLDGKVEEVFRRWESRR